MKAALFKSLIKFSGLFGLKGSRRLARFLAKLMWLFAKKTKHTITTNIQKCFPELSHQNVIQMSKKSLAHTLMNFFELGHLWKEQTKVDDVIDNIYGLEQFEKALSQGKGALIAAPHHGNWEVMNLFFSRFDGFAFLYKAPSDEKTETALKKFRGKSEAVQIEASLKGVRKIIKHLKSNGFLAILPDQKPKNGQGEFAPFFGHPAYTMTLFSRLAAKTKAPVFFTYAQRTKTGFDVYFEEAGEHIYQETKTSVNYLNQHIQKIVEKAPEQYQWTYRRFSIQPEKQKPFY